MTGQLEEPGGYTVVELIITIIVATIFLVSLVSMMGYVTDSAIDARRKETASNLAYNNLRKYASGERPLWFTCIGDETSEITPPFSDGKTYPNATGQVLIDETSQIITEDLPPPVVQKVFAIAPYGCGNSAKGMPIRIQSEVTYGSSGRKMVHATYVPPY